MWLSGGVAVDFLVGRWTRPHKDLDLVAFTPHRGQLERELGARGLALAHDEGWTTRWTVAGRPGADVEIVSYRFIAGYLDPRRYRELGGVRFRTRSAEGEWLNRLVDADLVPGRKPEPKLQHDVRLLQSLIPEPRRRELLGAPPTRPATGQLQS